MVIFILLHWSEQSFLIRDTIYHLSIVAFYRNTEKNNIMCYELFLGKSIQTKSRTVFSLLLSVELKMCKQGSQLASQHQLFTDERMALQMLRNRKGALLLEQSVRMFSNCKNLLKCLKSLFECYFWLQT